MDRAKKTTIITCSCLLGLLLTVVGINTLTNYLNPPDELKVDSNIYLGEEVCFAKEVYVSVSGINVTKEENTYYLNLETIIEQRCEDNKPDRVLIEPKNFALKSVNIKAKSQMNVFFESLFKATVSALVSGAVGGDINIIEETISFVGDYTSEAIKAAADANTKFKKVRANDTFNGFYPMDVEGKTALHLTFPVEEKNLKQTNNIIVLTVDQWNHVERRIFLITRPEKTIPV